MNSRFVFTFVIIFFLTQFSPVRLKFFPAPNHSPFSGFKPIPKKTPGPINIVTKNATNVFTKPLLVVAGLAEKWLLRQTGKSVEVILDQPGTVSLTTGGVLHNEVYIFHKFRFYWHDNATNFGHFSGTTVDGKHGAQLEPTSYFYKREYGSFENALNYTDGLVQFISRVFLLPIANPLFVPFGYYMRKIKKPGDSTPILSAFVYPWYNLFPPNIIYYAYPSSYLDEETGKMYDCVTSIVFPKLLSNFISRDQFRETFGSLVDSSGKPLINAVRQYPADSRPVKRAGILLLVNLIG